MDEMPNLGYLFFCVPHESTRPSQIGASFDRLSDFSDFDVYNLHLHSSVAIHVGLGAVLHDFRTSYYQHFPGDDLYRVDFRLAHAVLDGRAEIRNGECHLLE
jgi:hypothetical protein